VILIKLRVDITKLSTTIFITLGIIDTLRDT